MALFALYRILDEDRLHVFFSDVRPDGNSAQHHCTLQCRGPQANRLRLVRELSDELRRMGFGLEFDRRTVESSEIRFFCVHRIPRDRDAWSSAEAIRTVCLRYGLAVAVATHRGGQLLFTPASSSAHAESGSEQPAKSLVRIESPT